MLWSSLYPTFALIGITKTVKAVVEVLVSSTGLVLVLLHLPVCSLQLSKASNSWGRLLIGTQLAMETAV